MPVRLEPAEGTVDPTSGPTAALAAPARRKKRRFPRSLIILVGMLPLVLALTLPVVGFFRPLWVEVGEYGFAVQRFQPGRWPDGYSYANGFGITTHVLCVPLGNTRLAMGIYRNGWVRKGEPMVRFPAPKVE